MDTVRTRLAITRTLDISTSSLPDVRRALKAVGAEILAETTTTGAIGYTTITVRS